LWASLFVLVGTSLTADDRLERILSGTFRLADERSSGVCLLIERKPAAEAEQTGLALVTAAHVLEGMAGGECQLMLREARPDGTFVRRETTIPIRENQTPRWRKHTEQDLAALPVTLPENVAVSPFRFAELADEPAILAKRVRVGQSVWIPSFPAKMEANEAAWPVLRQGVIASYPLAPVQVTKTFLVDVRTFGGDSGAPVVVLPASDGHADGEILIAGLVLGMHRQTDKATLPFEELTFHTPLGLAVVAQAHFIRETMESLER